MVSKLVGATLAAALLLAFSGIAAANDLAAKLVGVWKMDASERKYDDGEAVKPMGDKPHGIAVLSKGGRMVFALHAADRKPPAGQPPTDAELAELYRTAFFASGTYEIEDDKGLVVIRYDASSSPAFLTFTSRSTLTVNGSTLTWVGPEFKDAKGRAFHNHFTFSRLE